MKLLRKLFGGISLTAAMFVFQACYGTGPEFEYRTIDIRVIEAESGNPIPNIKVMSQWQSNSNNCIYDWDNWGCTDSAGTISADLADYGLQIKFRFSDDDSVYAVKDTVFNSINFNTLDIVLSKQD